ncbi:MAG TPA: hypothetical protein VN726_22950 [Hanamia sp.]|nr:hypothetical protein [Hanamia sp.]
MERFLLKQEYVDKIKNDQILYGQIAYLIGVTILSMRAVLNENSPKLTQASALRHLKNYWGIENESELLEVIPDSEDNNNTHPSIMQASH